MLGDLSFIGDRRDVEAHQNQNNNQRKTDLFS